MDASIDAATPAARLPSNRTRWVGRAISALPVLFLAFDSTIKLAHLAPVSEAFARLGLPDRLAEGVGALEATLLAIHLVPRTAVLGATLLTGFLGGAVVLHLRIGDPLATHTLFPVYVGALLWAGLALRDSRVRAAVSPAR